MNESAMVPEDAVGFVARCERCERAVSPNESICATCGGVIHFRYEDPAPVADPTLTGMWRYHRALPLHDRTRAVSLGEGGTPLLPARSPDRPNVWFKNETMNPTGSQKDRALSVAVSHAVEIGASRTVVVSAGSTGISNAAYSARAGLPSFTVVTDKTPWQRTVACEVLGSTIIRVPAPIDELVARVAELSAAGEIYATSTARDSNPYQAEGPKTIALEIAEQLGGLPDWVVVPVGGGGTLSGIWHGFTAVADRTGERPPRLLAVVAEDFDALAVAVEQDLPSTADVYAPGHTPAPTLLTKIAHTHPPDGDEALSAVRASGGTVIRVSDAVASAAQSALGRDEGYFVEPSSAAVVPALDRARETGVISADERVVVLLSGSGHRETFHLSGPTRSPLEVRLDELQRELVRRAGIEG